MNIVQMGQNNARYDRPSFTSVVHAKDVNLAFKESSGISVLQNPLYSKLCCLKLLCGVTVGKLYCRDVMMSNFNPDSMEE